MSTTVDSKVVEMRFDNQNFEKNVKTSMSTIDKLKSSLNFSGSEKGFENINSSAKGVNLSGISSAVETVQSKFSALEVIAVTALATITNSAVSAGVQLVKSLSVDNIASGWTKFGEKTTSVGTLISQGYDLDTVNEQLERLNWFTDETSYNFTDMVSNIAKFTASGQDLTTSVTALEGIANWAALSGQNATTASHAMYQLSQAMGSGTMRKEDYKSIQNVSMDTDEFRQKALDAGVALGTLKKNADGTYISLVNANGTFTKSQFAEHLTEDAWFTSDVMMEVFNEYSSAVDQIYDYAGENNLTASEAIDELGDSVDEFGLKAFKAAQEARTWSDVIDSVKDAVSTGWMTTFELIFGNYEEAKSLWTDLANELYDVFAEGGNQRNELLSEWKDLGGREALINSLWNSFYALVDVINLVKESFHEVFPAMTAERLVSITKGLESLTEKFKMSDKTGANLKSTLKGLFAILDIAKQAVTALFGSLKPLMSLLPGIGDGILGTTASMGDWLVNLDESIKKNETFKKAIEKTVSFIQTIPSKVNNVFQAITGISIGDAFENIKQKVSQLLEKLKGLFGNFKDIDTSGVDSLGEKVRTSFDTLGGVVDNAKTKITNPLTSLFDGLKSVFSGIWKVVKKLSPIFLSLATLIGNALSGIGNYLSESIGNADFDGILDLVNGGVLVAIGVGIEKFVNTLSNVSATIGGVYGNVGGLLGSAGGILGSIQAVLGGVKDSLESWQKSLKANVLLKIAGAIALITASVFALSSIDSDKLSASLSAVTTEFIDLIASMSVLEKTTNGKGGAQLSIISTAMIKMSAAILILSFAMKNLANIEQDSLERGLTALTTLIAELVGASIALSKWGGKVKTSATGMILFAVAINVLVSAVKKVGELDFDVIKKGLTSVGIIMAELAAFMVGAKFGQFKTGQGLAIIELAAALLILQKAVSLFGAMETQALTQGLIGVGVVLTELAGFTNLMGKPEKIISTATGMTILGAAMLIFADAVKGFAQMSWEQMAQGLLGMGVALAEIAIVMNNMPATTPLIAAGMVLVGAALKIIASALSDFGNMSIEEIAKSLVTLSVSLAAIAIATNAMTGALSGAAALLVVSSALAILAPVLKSFGDMSLSEIGKSLLVLAGAFTVIGVAALVLEPVLPTIIGLAAAISLIGVGALACGAGLLAFSVGLTTLAASGTAAIAMLVLAIESIISLFPQISVKVAEGALLLLR